MNATNAPMPPLALVQRMAPGPLAKAYRRILAQRGEPHPDDMPDLYASICVGRCLEPIYHDGAHLAFSRVERPTEGDFVGIWLHPAETDAGRSLRAVKRLASSLDEPFRLSFPYSAGGNAVPIVQLEALNPHRRYMVPAHRIMAMHKVVGTAIPNGEGVARFVPLPA